MSASRYAKNPHIQIYELVDPISLMPKYIGKTNNPSRRISCHISDWGLKSCTHKNNWIKSLKTKGLKPMLKVIDEVPEGEWQFWEMHYISLYKSWGFNLTNSTDGGESGMIGDLNPAKRLEVRALLSSQKLGDKNPNFGKKSSRKQKDAVVKACKGRISPTRGITNETSESRKRVSEFNKSNSYKKGYKLTQTQKEKMGRPILQYTLEDVFVKEWAIISDAAKELNLTSCTNIIKCAQGKIKKSSNYIWKYKNNGSI